MVKCWVLVIVFGCWGTAALAQEGGAVAWEGFKVEVPPGWSAEEVPFSGTAPSRVLYLALEGNDLEALVAMVRTDAVAEGLRSQTLATAVEAYGEGLVHGWGGAVEGRHVKRCALGVAPHIAVYGVGFQVRFGTLRSEVWLCGARDELSERTLVVAAWSGRAQVIDVEARAELLAVMAGAGFARPGE